jgi:hypothetical protein
MHPHALPQLHHNPRHCIGTSAPDLRGVLLLQGLVVLLVLLELFSQLLSVGL